MSISQQVHNVLFILSGMERQENGQFPSLHLRLGSVHQDISIQASPRHFCTPLGYHSDAFHREQVGEKVVLDHLTEYTSVEILRFCPEGFGLERLAMMDTLLPNGELVMAEIPLAALVADLAEFCERGGELFVRQRVLARGTHAPLCQHCGERMQGTAKERIGNDLDEHWYCPCLHVTETTTAHAYFEANQS